MIPFGRGDRHRPLRLRSLILIQFSLILFALGMPERATGMRLCLQPVSLPFAKDDERRASLEQTVTRKLEQSGFKIVPSEEVREVAERVDEEWGEIIDPVTGRRISEKWEQYKRKLAQALGDELGCERRLTLSVALIRAPFANGSATWDGTQMSVTSAGRIVRNVLLGLNESGWLTALSLWIQVLDLNGDPLVFRSAGIEPLIDLSMSRGQDRLPEDQWLRNEEHLSRAIDSALGPNGLQIPERPPRVDP